MEPGPSEITEALVGWLVPPACREEVMGDMRERHRSSASYLLEAAHVIPCVIYSRICRTTDSVVTLIMLLAMYTAFVFAAWSFTNALLFDDRGFIRLAIPPAICVTIIAFSDAYSDPKRRAPLKPLFGPLLGLAVASIVQPVFGRWALPTLVWVWGSGISLLLLSIVRMTFPPITEQPQAANAPAFWRKLELSRISMSSKTALLPCGVLLLVIVYLLGK